MGHTKRIENSGGSCPGADVKMKFQVFEKDLNTLARRGQIETSHGIIDTPAFMPVGTAGSVKTITPDELVSLGAQIILGNAYHLYLRPGHQLIESFGGLHRFMSWDGALLTDSGGFQVMSMGKLCKITEDGVLFQSHLDGSTHFFSPDLSIEIQEALGADLIMAFDECLPFPSSYDQAASSLERTTRWAERCKSVHRREDQGLFGIVQGGFFPSLREQSARSLLGIGFDGYAIGGLSVGESQGMMREMVDCVVPLLPDNSPRYLMGVGKPEDLVEAVRSGIDVFDCVMPTRHARTGWLFTSHGHVVIKQARYEKDPRPIDETCECYTCQRFSRAYLRHLFMAHEILGLRLNTLHNLYFYLQLMQKMREAISFGNLEEFTQQFYFLRKEAEQWAG